MSDVRRAIGIPESTIAHRASRIAHLRRRRARQSRPAPSFCAGGKNGRRYL